MKRLTLLLSAAMLCIALMTACKSAQQTAATTAYPQWLQEKFSVLNDRYSEVTLFVIDNEPYYSVFVKGPDNSFDMNRTTIYNANGEVFLSLGGPRKRSDKEIQFFDRAVNKGVIWQSDIAREKSKE